MNDLKDPFGCLLGLRLAEAAFRDPQTVSELVVVGGDEVRLAGVVDAPKALETGGSDKATFVEGLKGELPFNRGYKT